ncbi:MAG: serine hydrolase domain-containing protein [Reyranellaceae bacterium]
MSDWQPIAPEKAGFAAHINERLDQAIADKRIWNVHGVVVMRGDRVVLERYFAGPDSARGRPLGEVSFDADTLHDLRSVSKSIVGLLYGIALERGKVPPPEAPLLSSFPAHASLAADPGRKGWTLHHVLSMTMGTDWDELSVPYSDPANSEIAMDRSPDRYRYVLERPLVFKPGQRWIYNGGATALLGRLIAESTGQSLHDFAREALFDPLGFGASEWLADDKGEAFAASGLRLSLRDLTRLGKLMLRGGKLGSKHVVSNEWLGRSTTPYVAVDEARRFGYHWYLNHFSFTVSKGPRWSRNRLEPSWGAYGNGGQRLWVLPGLDLVVAVLAGNYDHPEQGIPSMRVLREVVLASVE